MKINLDNYEAFFLDFYEGNLTPEQIEEMHAFIRLHPETRSSFEDFDMVVLDPDTNLTFAPKHSLKREETTPISANLNTINTDDLLISEIEGLLTEKQIIELQQAIQLNPSLETERKLYAATKLGADQTIEFSNKESLKHKAITVGEINEYNFEQFFINEIEGNLSTEELKNLEEFLLENPHLTSERKIYTHTRLVADSSIVFEDKESLKQKVVSIRRIAYYSLSAAAAVVLLIGVYSTYFRDIPASSISSSTLSYSTTEPKTDKQAQIEKPVNTPILSSVTEKPASIPENRSNRKSTNRVSPANNAPKNISFRDERVIPMLASAVSREISSKNTVKPEFMFIRSSQMHSNEFLELYYNIKLGEQLLYASMNNKDQNPEKTIYNSVKSKVEDIFASNHKNHNEEEGNLSLWTFAELGIKTYNNVAHDNVTLDLERDETGKVIGYNLEGDKLNVQKEINK
ncbi:MAG: hypothetical protein IPH88_04525 [Bacteroidales bacterium]|nr:hypothetical protein [Bacteroidales bacterium]